MGSGNLTDDFGRHPMPEDPLSVRGAASARQGLEPSGTLHIYVAFDWGEQIQLEQAARQVPGSRQELPRRRRTPSSISYRPPPLHLTLDPVPLELPEIGAVQAVAGVTLFDF